MTYRLTFTDSGQTGSTNIDAPGMGAAVAIFRRDHPGADLLTIDPQRPAAASTSPAGSAADGGRWSSIAPPEGFHKKTLTALDQAFPLAGFYQHSENCGTGAASVSVSVSNGVSAMLKKITTLRGRLLDAIVDRVARSMADYLLSHPAHRDHIKYQIAADKMLRAQVLTDLCDHWYRNREIDEDAVVEKVSEWHQDSIDDARIRNAVRDRLVDQAADHLDWDAVNEGVVEHICHNLSVDVTV